MNRICLNQQSAVIGKEVFGAQNEFTNKLKATKQQKNFINKQIKLQKYCPQLARLFEAGQCMQNVRNKE